MRNRNQPNRTREGRLLGPPAYRRKKARCSFVLALGLYEPKKRLKITVADSLPSGARFTLDGATVTVESPEDFDGLTVAESVRTQTAQKNGCGVRIHSYQYSPRDVSEIIVDRSPKPSIYDDDMPYG